MDLRWITAEEEQTWNERSLLTSVEAPRIALWGYREPAVVLGISQRRRYGARMGSVGLRILTRRSGGGAVLVGPEMLGVSVALPADHPSVCRGPVPAFEWFGKLHADALVQLGIACNAADPQEQRPSSPAGDPLDWACFGAIGAWEVVTRHGARKLVGLAQRRTRRGVLLVSGTLVGDCEWTRLCESLEEPDSMARLLASRTGSCRSELGRSIELAEVAHEVRAALRRGLLG